VGLALCGVACSTDFAPASQVSSLRVLGMRAEPAEPRPGQGLTLRALVVDPTRPDAGTAMLWLGCAPTAEAVESPCSNTDALLSLTAASDGGFPPGVALLGLGPQVATQAPVNVFPADAGVAERQQGVLGSAVLIAAAAPPPTTPAEATALLDRVRNGEVPRQVALFRYPISESETPNHNPVLDGYVVNGEPLPRGATLGVPAPSVTVDLAVPDEAFEPYVQHAPTEDLQRTEALAARYYATQLLVDIEAVQVRGTVEEKLLPGGFTSDPQSRFGRLWTVVRDTRGGQAWLEARTFACDATLPAPSATAASVDAGTLTLTGANLSSVLDVQLGDAVLANLQCAAATCSGSVPALDAGSYPLTLRAKSCVNVETGQSVAVP
jgi:hypothetical protein